MAPILGAENFLTALVESSNDAIIGATPAGIVLSWNTGAERLYGYKAEEMLGSHMQVLVPPDRRKEFAELLLQVGDGVIVQDLLTERRRKDGSIFPVSVTDSPIVDRTGVVIGISAIAHDVSAYVDVVEELDRERRSAADALSLLDTLQSTAPFGFSLVDRDFRFLRVSEKGAAMNGFSVDEHLGRTMAEVIPKIWPQIEPALREVLTEGKAVFNREVTGENAEDPGRIHTWLESYYPVRINNDIVGIGDVFIDITERKDAEEAQKDLTRAAVDAIAATTEARDPYTAGHQSRVASLASSIATRLGVDTDAIEGIDLAARIHDLGKIAIPSEILTKSTALSDPEWQLIKTHSRVGADIVRGINFHWPVAEMIEQHHERLNGSGYPGGLIGDDICLGARIIAVADVVEAMASHRPYRPARGLEAALEEIGRGRGTLFDPRVADACLQIFRGGGYRLEGGVESATLQSPSERVRR